MARLIAVVVLDEVGSDSLGGRLDIGWEWYNDRLALGPHKEASVLRFSVFVFAIKV